jgi:hypothetical protein
MPTIRTTAKARPTTAITYVVVIRTMQPTNVDRGPTCRRGWEDFDGTLSAPRQSRRWHCQHSEAQELFVAPQ